MGARSTKEKVGWEGIYWDLGEDSWEPSVEVMTGRLLWGCLITCGMAVIDFVSGF